MKKLSPSLARRSGGAPVVVQSDDGSVQVYLQVTRFGLWVQRERLRVESRARLVHCVVFQDSRGFERWCDSDSLRFDYPIVSAMVKHQGGVLMSEYERAAIA